MYVSIIRIIFILTIVAYMTSVTLTDERDKNDWKQGLRIRRESALPFALALPKASYFISVSFTAREGSGSHSSPLACKIPWTEEPGRRQSMGSCRVRHNWATSLSLSCIGDGNGNPLQCSCLENPRDREAWWAAIYGVTQSWTRLKRLSSSEFEQKKSLSKPTQNPLPNEIPRRGN